jgi:hypothetical protein
MALAVLIERTLDVKEWICAFNASAGVAKKIEVHTISVFECWFRCPRLVMKDIGVGFRE